MKAWHFTDGWQLRDGQELVVGKTYRHDGELTLCPSEKELAQGKGGYHGSKRILDAFYYAPGTVVSWCEFSEIGEVQDDKFVARERTVLWAYDIEMILHEFACRCAEHALKYGNGDRRSCAVIAAKRRWMRGEIGDTELAADRDAARAAVRDAVRDAAMAAAMAAARDAARAAAWDAARKAAWAAAREAAREAAWDAARDAAWDAARDAARAAAWKAAWESARAAQNRLLRNMVIGGRVS
jgi:hypothetical protein